MDKALLSNKLRDSDAIKTMSQEEKRNTIIVELGKLTGMTGPQLLPMTNVQLLQLVAGKYLKSKSSFHTYLTLSQISLEGLSLDGAFLSNSWRDSDALQTMTQEEKRNTIIVELGKLTGMTGPQLLPKTNVQLLQLLAGKYLY